MNRILNEDPIVKVYFISNFHDKDSLKKAWCRWDPSVYKWYKQIKLINDDITFDELIECDLFDFEIAKIVCEFASKEKLIRAKHYFNSTRTEMKVRKEIRAKKYDERMKMIREKRLREERKLVDDSDSDDSSESHYDDTDSDSDIDECDSDDE